MPYIYMTQITTTIRTYPFRGLSLVSHDLPDTYPHHVVQGMETQYNMKWIFFNYRVSEETGKGHE